MVPLSDATKAIPEHKNSKATGELYFKVTLPALGFNTYSIKASSGELPSALFGIHLSNFSVKPHVSSLNRFRTC